ncbi:MAG TPA: non-canonical purine NTP pyrophosphatase [Phycisphaerales bacterium]|nr:non-canonical purine NTP pyrophosphatase [Phycisphaerales bacterium]
MPDTPSVEIVLATGNPHKVEELRAIFKEVAGDSLRIVGLGDLPGYPFPEPAETGTTFEQNASLKALAYAQATGRLCLADDSGLEIDALGGRPGVVSSHYCTDGREEGMDRPTRDAANNQRVLRELTGVPDALRAARFVCVMALARSGQILARARGTFEGRIGTPPAVPAGANGFGYDPLFVIGPGFTVTSAQLSAEEKNARSHRAAAAQRMAQHMTQLFTKAPAEKDPAW